MSISDADWSGLRDLLAGEGVDLDIDWDALISGQGGDDVPQELLPYLEEYDEQIDMGETVVGAVLGDEDDDEYGPGENDRQVGGDSYA